MYEDSRIMYFLKRSTMGGIKVIYKAYDSKEVAENIAETLKETFVGFTVHEIDGYELIEGERLIHDNFVFSINRSTAKDHIKQIALSKLTDKEKKALGFEADCKST